MCCPNYPSEGSNTEFGNPCGASCAGLSDADLIGCQYGTCDDPDAMCMCPLI